MRFVPSAQNKSSKIFRACFPKMRQSKAISPVMGIPLTFRWKLFVSPRRYF